MLEILTPTWPVASTIRALVTLRSQGTSRGAYAAGNLADHVGDDKCAVDANRRALQDISVADIGWLQQVHGTTCIAAENVRIGTMADASFTRQTNRACAVLTADCLPVLLTDASGSIVAAAHAGWRGLAAGIIESTIQAMAVSGEQLLAWLGPAIGPQAFVVGDDVRNLFIAHDNEANAAFMRQADDKYTCDLYALARLRLQQQGVMRIYGGNFCTYSETQRFYSYRRERITGRMATLIWRAG